VIDSNTVQDDFYDLYVNESFVGAVNNAKGGTTTHTVNLQPGSNNVELRLTTIQCCTTFLSVDINGEFVASFGGTNDHIWTIDVVEP